MDRRFRLPDLGEGLTEAEVVAWHVSAGDHVVTGQPLVSVETDKAVVDVPSPRSGHIERTHGEVGEIIAVGSVLVEFAGDEHRDPGAIVGDSAGEGDNGQAPAKDRPRAAPRAQRVSAAPAVRRRASELGVDLAGVAGTGKDGSVTVADVEAAASSTQTLDREPLRGVRRSMFRNMTRAGRAVVRATITDEADIDHWPAQADVTVRLALALAAGCRASPALNAALDESGETRTLHDDVHIGIAMETDNGLFTPVLTDAGSAGEADLREQLNELKHKVAARTIEPERLAGQTITLSNFGMFGGRFAELVVMPPQVAILGAGRIEARAVVRHEQIVVHRLIPLSLTFDHRAATGAEAARFLAAVVAALESDE
jgi:pyruvate dehydrogenase E2 component (dihydrolipoamide acetyltransferase)